MRRISFMVTMLSLLLLLILLNSSPKPLASPDNLSTFQPNQKFLIQGNVIKETLSKNYKTLFLMGIPVNCATEKQEWTDRDSQTKSNTIIGNLCNNEFQLQCPSPCPSFLNKNISATVILEKYNNKNYLKVLEIKSMD